jgi:hypothetical protein
MMKQDCFYNISLKVAPGLFGPRLSHHVGYHCAITNADNNVNYCPELC